MKMKHSVTRCFAGVLAVIIAAYSFCGCGEDSESSAYVSDNTTNTVAESTNAVTSETSDNSSHEASTSVELQESVESSEVTVSTSSEQGTIESDIELVEVTTTVATTIAEPVEVTTSVTTTKPVEVTTAVTTTEPVEITATTTQLVEVKPETEETEFSPVTDFEYTITDGEVIINLYMGTDSTVIIPSEIEDCPVVSIERIDGCESVFHPGPWFDDSGMMHNGNSIVTEIIIPDGVRYIGDGAFVKCWALTSIVIPDSVTSIGASAFYECTQLTSITIPDNVTYIGDHAFDGRVCPSVTYKDQVYDTSENYIAVFNAINNR